MRTAISSGIRLFCFYKNFLAKLPHPYPSTNTTYQSNHCYTHMYQTDMYNFLQSIFIIFRLNLPRTFSYQSSRFELPLDISILSSLTPLGTYINNFSGVDKGRGNGHITLEFSSVPTEGSFINHIFGGICLMNILLHKSYFIKWSTKSKNLSTWFMNDPLTGNIS